MVAQLMQGVSRVRAREIHGTDGSCTTGRRKCVIYGRAELGVVGTYLALLTGMYTQAQLDAPRMTDSQIAAHLETIKDPRPHVAGRASDALAAEWKRLGAAWDMAKRAGVGDIHACLENIQAFAKATGHPRYIKAAERRFARHTK